MAQFMWYDVLTSDAESAKTFYCNVVGWNAAPAQIGDPAYTVLSAGDDGIGGIFTMNAEQSANFPRSSWMGYIAVDDVDVYTQRVTAAGGELHRAPSDIPGVGRFSVVADPQGAPFFLFKPNEGQTRTAVPPETPGAVSWHELRAAEPESALAFYVELFGWKKTGTHDMGAMGIYHMFAFDEFAVGGMMLNSPGTPGPHWLFFFTVEAAQAGANRVTAGGGKVLHGPSEVPGGSWVLYCLDPLGAPFALTAAKL